MLIQKETHFFLGKSNLRDTHMCQKISWRGARLRRTTFQVDDFCLASVPRLASESTASNLGDFLISLICSTKILMYFEHWGRRHCILVHNVHERLQFLVLRAKKVGIYHPLPLVLLLPSMRSPFFQSLAFRVFPPSKFDSGSGHNLVRLLGNVAAGVAKPA